MDSQFFHDLSNSSSFSGQMMMECKQVYHYGAKGYFRSYYNVMDTIANSMYLASYTLRIVVELKLNMYRRAFSAELRRAETILYNETYFWQEDRPYFKFRNELFQRDDAYWLRGCEWMSCIF